MRKGLAIVLGTVVFALVGATSFAKSPVISGVPDLIIGDAEDSLTIDNNWFRYQNAFNIIDYTTDEDSTPTTELQFVFLEENSYNDISINDKTQIDAADAEAPENWGPNEFTGFGSDRNFLLSFVDLVRSGGTQNPEEPYFADPVDENGDPIDSSTVAYLPWHDEAGDLVGSGDPGTAIRTVFLFTADQHSKIGSDTMLVMSLNAGTDKLSGAVTTLFETDFPDGAGTLWQYSPSTPGAVPAATSGEGAGYLSLEAGLTATGTGGAWSNKYFGRWATYAGANAGAFEHVEGNVIYGARFTLEHNVTLPGDVPRIRLSAAQANSYQAVNVLVSPIYNADATFNTMVPAMDTPMDYWVLWAKNETADYDNLLWDYGTGVADLRAWNVSFDVFDEVDQQGGKWTLTNCKVVTTQRPADVAASDTVTDFSGWTTQSGQGAGVSPITVTNTGTGVTLYDPGVPSASTPSTSGNYYLLASQMANTEWTAGKTIRTSVELSCPDAASRGNFHRFRMRQFNGGAGLAQVTQELYLQGDNGGALSTPEIDFASMPPVGSTFSYEAYMPSYGGPSTVLADSALDGEKWNVALDGLHNIRAAGWLTPTSYTATEYTVHSVALEVINDPL